MKTMKINKQVFEICKNSLLNTANEQELYGNLNTFVHDRHLSFHKIPR